MMYMQGTFYFLKKKLEAAKNGRTGPPLYSDAIAARRWVDSLKVEDVEAKLRDFEFKKHLKLWCSYHFPQEWHKSSQGWKTRFLFLERCEAFEGCWKVVLVSHRTWHQTRQGRAAGRRGAIGRSRGDPGDEIRVSWKAERGVIWENLFIFRHPFVRFQPISEETVIWWFVRWILNWSVARKVWSHWNGIISTEHNDLLMGFERSWCQVHKSLHSTQTFVFILHSRNHSQTFRCNHLSETTWIRHKWTEYYDIITVWYSIIWSFGTSNRHHF